MSIGDKKVYPKAMGDAIMGLTYREWLIGMLASNVGAIVRSEGFENDIAEGLIRQADAIIKQLDKEVK